MIAGKCLLDYANLFSNNDYKKNDKIRINKTWFHKLKTVYSLILSKVSIP